MSSACKRTEYICAVALSIPTLVRRSPRHQHERQGGMPPAQRGLVMTEPPDPGALRQQLARWTAAGLIDSDQADRIEAAERERAAAVPRRRLPIVTEVLGYVGAVIAMTAIVVTVHKIWKHVPTAVELGTAGVIAVGLLLAGAALRADSDLALARLRSVLWLFSTAGAAAFVAVLTDSYLHLADKDVALATAAAWLV